MSKTDLATIVEIPELLPALSALWLSRREAGEAHPLNERSTTIAVQASEVWTLGKRESHPRSDVPAFLAGHSRELGGDGVGVELHYKGQHALRRAFRQGLRSRRQTSRLYRPARVNFSAIPVQLRVILGAAALTAVAAFLPWASAFGISVSGIRGDGVITLLLAVGGGGLILANRTGRVTSAVLEGLLGAVVLVVALYHVNDPFAAIGIYLTLLGGLVWVGALAWWWFSPQTQPQAASPATPSNQDLAGPVEPAQPTEQITKSEGGSDRPGAT